MSGEDFFFLDTKDASFVETTCAVVVIMIDRMMASSSSSGPDDSESERSRNGNSAPRETARVWPMPGSPAQDIFWPLVLCTTDIVSAMGAPPGATCGRDALACSLLSSCDCRRLRQCYFEGSQDGAAIGKLEGWII